MKQGLKFYRSDFTALSQSQLSHFIQYEAHNQLNEGAISLSVECWIYRW